MVIQSYLITYKLCFGALNLVTWYLADLGIYSSVLPCNGQYIAVYSLTDYCPICISYICLP